MHAVGVADEEGTLGEETAPALFARHLDRPELRPEDVLHAVELGEVLVEHDPVAVDQGQDVEVLREHPLEEGDGLLAHVALHEASEARELARVDGHLLEAVEAQPLLGEGLDEAARAGIVEHAVDLSLELTAQRAGAREGAQLLVRRRIPQEERQSRGEDPVVGLDDLVAVGLGLRHVEEVRGAEGRGEHLLDRLLEGGEPGAASAPEGVVPLDRLVGHRATEGALEEGRDDLAGVDALVSAVRRVVEDLGVGGRRPLRMEGRLDLDGLHEERRAGLALVLDEVIVPETEEEEPREDLVVAGLGLGDGEVLEARDEGVRLRLAPRRGDLDGVAEGRVVHPVVRARARVDPQGRAKVGDARLEVGAPLVEALDQLVGSIERRQDEVAEAGEEGAAQFEVLRSLGEVTSSHRRHDALPLEVFGSGLGARVEGLLPAGQTDLGHRVRGERRVHEVDLVEALRRHGEPHPRLARLGAVDADERGSILDEVPALIATERARHDRFDAPHQFTAVLGEARAGRGVDHRKQHGLTRVPDPAARGADAHGEPALLGEDALHLELGIGGRALPGTRSHLTVGDGAVEDHAVLHDLEPVASGPAQPDADLAAQCVEGFALGAGPRLARRALRVEDLDQEVLGAQGHGLVSAGAGRHESLADAGAEADPVAGGLGARARGQRLLHGAAGQLVDRVDVKGRRLQGCAVVREPHARLRVAGEVAPEVDPEAEELVQGVRELTTVEPAQDRP